MFTTTDDRVELVYTGRLTLRCDGPNATGPDDHERWVLKTMAGVGLKPHTVTVSIRGFNARELAKASVGMHLPGEALTEHYVDSVYNSLGQAAQVSQGTVGDLLFAAAQHLWAYAAGLSRGEDYEANFKTEQARIDRARESADSEVD